MIFLPTLKQSVSLQSLPEGREKANVLDVSLRGKYLVILKKI